MNLIRKNAVWLGGCLSTAPLVSVAKPAAQLMQTTHQTLATPQSSLFQLIFGLFTVLALILVSAWLLKKMTGFTGKRGDLIQHVGSLSVGQRERVSIVQVGDQQWLLGITQSSIRCLHAFDEPVEMRESQPITGAFAAQLRRVMDKGEG